MNLVEVRLLQVTMNYHKTLQITSSFGFTLMELLVVIVIISLLAGIGGMVYTSARRSGRDSTRQADLKRIQNALEIYYSDHRPHKYPVPFDGTQPAYVFVYGLATDSLCEESWALSIHPEPLCNDYIKEFPEDPTGWVGGPAGIDYRYHYQALDLDGDGETAECYCLSAKMEKLDPDGDGNPGSDTEKGTCDHYSDYNYTITCP